MKFKDLDLEDSIIEGIDAMNFEEPTPVQEHSIPIIMEGSDIIACAQTGTGKTAAYVIPLLHRLLREKQSKTKIRAIIMAPTRELAQQIDVQIQGFSYFANVSSTVVYGGGDGSDWDRQKKGMLMGVDIVIATPGRLIAHIANSGIDISGVEFFILDEADRMLDMGFFDDIMSIVEKIPKKRQTIMFSATLPPKIRELAKKILISPKEINIAISKPNDSIIQSAYICYEPQKMQIINMLFASKNNKKCIIFSSSKAKVKDLAKTIRKTGLNSKEMHSDLSQEEREKVMLDFKNGKIDILVGTDVISRGIDIDDIGVVINYDVPSDPEDYIHRIGRTARADADGVSITFVNEDEQIKFKRIEDFLGKDIYKIPLPIELGDVPNYNPQKRQKPIYQRKRKNFKKKEK